MVRLTTKQRSARRTIALTLFTLIVLGYGALVLLFPSPVPVDSTIVPFARVIRVAVDNASTNGAVGTGLPSDRAVHELR
jgi:hypothetical protein